MRQLAIYQAPILGRLFFFNPPPPASPNAFQASQLFRNCALASDLLPNLPSFIRRVCSGFALRPFFGSPEAGVFRLIHDGGLAAPSRLSNVIGGFCPIAPWGRSSL